MSFPLYRDKAHFFRWVVNQPRERSTRYLFEDYIKEHNLPPGDYDDVDYDVALAIKRFKYCYELSYFIFDKNLLPNIEHKASAKRIVWESFANHLDASKTISFYFDGSGESRVAGVINPEALEDTPLISPLYNDTSNEAKSLDFTEAFQILFVDPLINEGDFGTIDFRFNSDPAILFDHTKPLHKKAFDDITT